MSGAADSPNDRDEQRDNSVGYKRPPVEHRFKPGNSGRPKGIVDRRAMAKRHVLEFLARGDEDLLPREERLKILLNSPDHSIRMQAEKFIADHDWGRPKETHEYTGLDGGPMEFVGMTLEQKRESEQKLLREMRLIEAPDPVKP